MGPGKHGKSWNFTVAFETTRYGHFESINITAAHLTCTCDLFLSLSLGRLQKTATALPHSQTSLSFFEGQVHARTKGRGKGARRLADFVFKMVARAIADDYVIFRPLFRPVHLAYLEQKIACPHPQCKEEPVFCQRNGLQHHYRRCHPEARFLPKIEEAAVARMKTLHGRETRNLLEKLFENRSWKVALTYL